MIIRFQRGLSVVKKTLDSRFRGNDDIKDRGVAHFRNAHASRTFVMLMRRALS